MKRIYNSNAQVFHLFANKLQDEAKTSTRNVFFNKDSIYSYGYHYKLGLHLDNNAMLINNKGYSITTSKHISELSQASRHKTIFYSQNVLIYEVLPRLEDYAKKVVNARKEVTKAYYIDMLNYIYNSFVDFQKYCIDNKINKIIWSKENRINLIVDKRSKEYKRVNFIYDSIKGNIKELESQIKAANEKQKKKEKQRQKEQTKLFRDNKITFARLNFDLLKLVEMHSHTANHDRQEDFYIATSQNVKLSIEESNEAIKKLEQINYNADLINKHLKGQRIKYYTITGAKQNALIVGCHKVKFEEIKRIKKQLIKYNLYN
tara:strand:- start:692 stop:1645 length:954 start_codon:yes stop_codon:yes gene_type:complete